MIRKEYLDVNKKAALIKISLRCALLNSIYLVYEIFILIVFILLR